jgi:ABC-type molybdate transport system substrate-binding protein
VGVVVVVAVAGGCAGGGTDRRVASAPVEPRVSGYITVVAADAIAPTIEREAQAFRTRNPLASVTVEAGASSTLSRQVRDGRTADLFVAAGDADMDAVIDAPRFYGAPEVIARGPRSSPSPVPFSIVVLSATGDQITARAFMRFLTTPEGRSILRSGGFTPRG